MNNPRIITRDYETDLFLATKLMHWVLVDDPDRKSEIAQIWCCLKNSETVMVGYPYIAYNISQEKGDKIVYDHLWSIWSPSSDSIDLFRAETALRQHEILLVPAYIQSLCEMIHLDLSHNNGGNEVKLANLFILLNASPAEKALALRRAVEKSRLNEP